MSNTEGAVMSEVGHDDELLQPVTWRHQFANTLNAALVQIAVIASNQVAGKEQGDRIEKVLSALHVRHDSLDNRMGHLERDMEIRTERLNSKIASLEERFTTPRNIVFAMVGAILLAFIGGLIALVFRK